VNGADRLAGFQRLQEALGDDGTDQRVLAVDLETPERPVNSEPAAVTVEQFLDVIGDRTPIAIQRCGVEEILQFQVAMLLDDPAAIHGESLAVHGCADDRR
jgi:hypothetical protein